MRTIHVAILGVVLTMICSVAVAAAKEEFPGRAHKIYKAAPYIELDDFHNKVRAKDVVIVDVRSRFEYDTLRIKDAINIPVALKSFEQEVQLLRDKSTKTIAFYCNGHTCMKSYKAAIAAMNAGISDVVAYDAGVFTWAKAYPNEAVLLGKSPVNAKEIIAKKDFKKHLLDPDTFSDRATQERSSVIVLDIRDKYQRAGVGFFPGQERWVSLNKMEKIYDYLKKAKRGNKTLYIYDEVGKQVRWLQYALERAGIKNYYFMDSGAAAYYKMLAKSSWQ